MLCPGDLADEGQNHKEMCSAPSPYSSCCLSPTCVIKFMEEDELNKLEKAEEGGGGGGGIRTPSVSYIRGGEG